MLTSGGRVGDKERRQTLNIAERLMKPAKQSDLFDAIVRSLGGTGVGDPGDVELPTDFGLGELKILLTEDNVVNQKLAIGILSKYGHRVTVANNGQEAMDLLAEHSFDLVLMDVQMPIMDGLTATRKIREREKETGTRTPIIAMTAHAMKGDREDCLEAGMDEYVAKPIRVATLFDKLSSVLLSKQNPAATHSRGTLSGAAAAGSANDDPEKPKKRVDPTIDDSVDSADAGEDGAGDDFDEPLVDAEELTADDDAVAEDQEQGNASNGQPAATEFDWNDDDQDRPSETSSKTDADTSVKTDVDSGSGGPPICWDRLTSNVNGNTPLIAALFEAFAEESQSLRESLQTAIADGDSKSLRVAAHTLKGASMAIAATALSELSRTLEECGYAETFDGVESTYQALLVELDATMDVIEQGVPDEAG